MTAPTPDRMTPDRITPGRVTPDGMTETRADSVLAPAEDKTAASYETFMRVKGGISDGALRAAGLPPARDLTYDAYLAAFSPPKTKEQDALDRLRGEHVAPAMPRAEGYGDQPPGPPPLGRRLVLAEASDGTWRILNDPDRPFYAPPPRRYFAKTVGMLMGITFAFVVAAYVSAVYLQPDHATAGRAAGAEIGADIGTEAPASLQLDTASGGVNAAATPLVSPPPSPTAKKGIAEPPPPPASAAPADLPVEIVAPRPEAQPVPTEAVSVEPPAPEPAPIQAAVPTKSLTPQPRQVKPTDLPKSTPTAKQSRLPNTTKPASTP